MKNKDIKYLKNIDKPPAVLAGYYPIIALGAIRSFAKENIPTFLISYKKSEAFFSKYTTGFICPDPLTDEGGFIEYLIDFGKNLETKGVLFPITDREILPTLKWKKKLEKYFFIPMADLNIVDQLFNKKKLYKLLKELNINHPKTYFPENISDVEQLRKRIQYPCIIKPTYHNKILDELGVKLFKVDSKEELVEKTKRFFQNNSDFIIQEFVPSIDSDFYHLGYFIDKSNSYKISFPFHRVRGFPLNKGGCSFVENIDQPELEQIIEYIIKEIKFFGVLEAEFVKDKRNQSFKLIEINPRFWKTISYPSSRGLNFPVFAYNSAIGISVSENHLNEIDMKWIDFRTDIISGLQNVIKKNISLQSWLRSYQCKKELSVFSRNDPLPFLVLIANGIFGSIPYLLHFNTNAFF